MRRLPRPAQTRGLNRLRQPRGVTLVATVLLSALAATITLVVVRQTVLVTRTESVRTDYGRAYAAALDVQSAFEQQLRTDPTFYLTSVFAYERPRHCQTPPTDPTPVFYSAADKKLSAKFPWALPPVDPKNPAGSPDSNGTLGLNGADRTQYGVGTWPAQCGPTWTYLDTGKELRGYPGQSVRAEITPPTADDPSVTLRVLAHVGQQETGLSATYRPSTAAAFTVYSGTDLHLDQLYTPDPTTTAKHPLTVTGTVYADGRVWLPADTNLSVGSAHLYAEDGFTGTPDTTTARLAAATSTSTTAQGASDAGPSTPGHEIADLRTSVPQPRTMQSLRASADRLASIGCPAEATTTAVNYPSDSPRAGHSSSLCLRSSGKVITATADTAKTLPANIAAWLVLPARDNVKVYYATTTPKVAGDCTLRCNPLELAGADLAAGVHPGGALSGSNLWTYAGTFLPPSSGVVATDATTYVSHCLGFAETAAAANHDLYSIDDTPLTVNGTAQTGPACAPETDDKVGGVVATSSLTILAGTAADPADLVIAGPIRTPKNSPAHLGLVATGQVKLPYFARPAGADLPIKASVLAYGFGAGVNAPSMQALPAQMPDPASATSDELSTLYGRTLRIKGSLAGANLNGPVSGFTSVRIDADPTLSVAAPPYFPAFSDQYSRASTSRLSSQAVCGSALSSLSALSSSSGPARTCDGLW